MVSGEALVAEEMCLLRPSEDRCGYRPRVYSVRRARMESMDEALRAGRQPATPRSRPSLPKEAQLVLRDGKFGLSTMLANQ